MEKSGREGGRGQRWKRWRKERKKEKERREDNREVVWRGQQEGTGGEEGVRKSEEGKKEKKKTEDGGREPVGKAVEEGGAVRAGQNRKDRDQMKGREEAESYIEMCRGVGRTEG